MDRVTEDLNAYLDRLETINDGYEEKIERIMKDPEFKQDLHDVCKHHIKDDPAQPEHIQAFNRVRNKMHKVADQLIEGEGDGFEEIQNVTILDLCAIELANSGSVARDYAEERFGDYDC